MEKVQVIGRIVPVLRVNVLITLLALGVATVNAESLTLQVIDSSGQPVQDAVLSWSVTSDGSPSDEAINYEVMDQVDKAFSPHVLVVNAGAVVSFPNSDSLHHHVYSFSPAKTFEIGLYSGEEAAPVIFGEPGVVVLGCNIHDVMLGYIFVDESPDHAKSDAQGNVSIDLPISSVTQLRVWHPEMLSDGNLLTLEQAEVKANSGKIQIFLKPKAAVRTTTTPLEQRFESLRKSRNDS